MQVDFVALHPHPYYQNLLIDLFADLININELLSIVTSVINNFQLFQSVVLSLQLLAKSEKCIKQGEKTINDIMARVSKGILLVMSVWSLLFLSLSMFLISGVFRSCWAKQIKNGFNQKVSKPEKLDLFTSPKVSFINIWGLGSLILLAVDLIDLMTLLFFFSLTESEIADFSTKMPDCDF